MNTAITDQLTDAVAAWINSAVRELNDVNLKLGVSVVQRVVGEI
jgi:hypothetical protein